ncbi:hypothetical protein [Kitasatospora sp. NBC_01302]|uniref:hypothetical protein n=1 Tax=Kitasatospora sp. NBC_01302 TaxID=2903575 RepID=UPI002E127650|nr:hypothetical protein OG294_08115 [Kitasatospora sp. NBC_01302]
MKRMPPDPDRLEQYQQRLREFAARPPYPVHGLRRPVVVPAVLAGWETEDEVTVAATLAYGDWRETDGPYLTVTTEPPGSAGQPADLLKALLREIRNGRLPRTRAEPIRRTSPQGELCLLGGSWALRTAVGDQAVTVLGHGPSPEDVELGPVADLLPYVLERNVQIARLAAEQRTLPEPQLPPASGVAAVRAFLETFVPGGPDAGAAYRALARRAVAELAKVLECDSEQAEDQLYSMVNQLSQLRLKVPWFTERDGPRAAALEELLRYVGLRQPVASETAQLRWERYWAAQQRATDENSAQLLAHWVQAWVEWAAERGN